MSRFNNLEFEGRFDENLPHRPPLKDHSYYLSEARSAFVRGRFEQALRHYGKVIEHDPALAPAWTGQVQMLIELGEFKEAKLWADQALQRFPNEPELLGSKAVALARTGDTKAALIFSDNAVEAGADAPYVWLARGDVFLARGERRADFCFDRALALAAGDWVIRWSAARVHGYYELFSRSLRFAQEALALDGAQAPIWLELGRCQYALGLVGPAENSFLQARQLDPACESAALALTELSQAGLWTRFRGWWRQVFRG